MRKLIGVSLLLAATACVSSGTLSHKELVPSNGPKARVYTQYWGGGFDRTVRTSFNVDQNAHVIVGRLSGDGTIEILYPESPKAATLVRGGQSYQARTFNASRDAYPGSGLYYYATRPRSQGAVLDSYDGRGNGFVFIIATQFPMFTDLLDDHGVWSDSLVVDDYQDNWDPRYAIKGFAEELTRGMPYSLDYASSYSSLQYTSYASQQHDCALLAGPFGHDSYSLRNYGYGGVWLPAFGWWFTGFDGFAFYFLRPPMFYTNGFTSLNACGLGYYGPYRYSNYGPYGGWYLGDNTPTQTAKPSSSLVPPTPQPRAINYMVSTRRPGFGMDGSQGAFDQTRSRSEGKRTMTQSSTSTWAPPIVPTTPRHNSGERLGLSSRSFGSGTASSGSRSYSGGGFNGGNAGSGGASSSSGTSSSGGGLGGGSRSTVAASAPAPAAPAAPAPSPRVESSSAGKPRNP